MLTAATQLFALKPFHKVLLSDVAQKASVGKGLSLTRTILKKTLKS
ncbi:MAG: helix-turn-helix transcriptional regulator [Deltaproteobacteria bacterium]|nr:helix-turn-helix transcriptional regulator [Deltaproteobacteria bacterium]